MALINCPECNKEVSDKAEMCPHCGYKLPKQEPMFQGVYCPSCLDSSIKIDIDICPFCHIKYKDSIYGTIYDLDGCDTSRNIASQTLQLLNSKYMTVVSNSNLNCDSGSITGTFIKINCDDYTVDQNGGLQYRNDFKNRLANKKPLILKIDDGRIWMIRVTGNPNDTQGGHRDIRQITFEWVEIGDINDMRTLYMNGLSDVDGRWW